MIFIIILNRFSLMISINLKGLSFYPLILNSHFKKEKIYEQYKLINVTEKC